MAGLLCLGWILLSSRIPKPGLARGLLGGSLGTFLLLFPTFSFLNGTLQTTLDPAFLVSPAFSAMILLGFASVGWGILSRPGGFHGGMLQGFFAVLVPWVMLFPAYVVARNLHGPYLQLLASSERNLRFSVALMTDGLISALQDITLGSMVLLAGGAIGNWRGGARQGQALVDRDPGWSSLLFDLLSVTSLFLLLAGAFLFQAVPILDRFFLALGFVPKVAVKGMAFTMLFPLLLATSIIWGLFAGNPRLRKEGRGVHAQFSGALMILIGAAGIVAFRMDLAIDLWMILLGMILLHLGDRKAPGEPQFELEPRPGFPLRLTAGGLAGSVVILPLVYQIFAAALGFLPMILHFPDRWEGRTFSELRRICPIDWALPAHFVLVGLLCLFFGALHFREDLFNRYFARPGRCPLPDPGMRKPPSLERQ